MARLAIYIDGGYFDQISRNLGVRVDFAKFVNEIQTVVASGTPGTLDLLRTYYYDSLPFTMTVSPTRAIHPLRMNPASSRGNAASLRR